MKYNSQRDATFAVVSEILKSNGIEFIPGKTDARPHFGRGSAMKATAVAMLVKIFTNHDAPLVSEQTDLKKYCSGLLSNWLRKDSDFNGGEEYVPTVGRGDETLSNLKKLLVQVPEAKAEIEAEIAKREAAIAAERAAKKGADINADAIPEHLRHLVKKVA